MSLPAIHQARPAADYPGQTDVASRLSYSRGDIVPDPTCIHSQQKWLGRVVLDTNAPMPTPAKVAQAAVAPAEPQAKTGGP
jgi:hypothetical protein